MTDIDEWVTIAEAAKKLEIAPRQVRRYADRLEDRDRDTRGQGQGQSLLYVRYAAIIAARTQSRIGQYQQGQRTGTRRDRDTSEDRDMKTDLSLSPTSVSLAVAYEKVIDEQKARIVDLQTALEHERHQTRQLNEALLREQQLRLLTAPIVEEAQLTPDTASGQGPVTKPGFWSRLFGPKDKQA